MMIKQAILVIAAILTATLSTAQGGAPPTPAGSDFDFESSAEAGKDIVEIDCTAGGYGTLDVTHVYKWNAATNSWDDITSDCTIDPPQSNPEVDLPGTPASGDKYRFKGKTSTRPTGGQNDISDKMEATWSS